MKYVFKKEGDKYKIKFKAIWFWYMDSAFGLVTKERAEQIQSHLESQGSEVSWK